MGDPSGMTPNPPQMAEAARAVSVENWVQGVQAVPLLAVVGYGLYASLAEAWPIDWIDLAQLSLFGSYSRKASALVFLSVGMLATTLVFSRVEGRVRARISGFLGAKATQPSSALPSTQPPVPARRTWSRTQWSLVALAGALILIWAGGFIAYEWLGHEESGDMNADYRPLRLDDDPAGVFTEGEHLAVRGSVLFDQQIKKTIGGAVSYYVLPLVPVHWHGGEPIRLLLKVDHLAEVYGTNPAPQQPGIPSIPGIWRGSDATPKPDPVPLLIRVGGTLPVTDTHRYRTLARDYHVAYVIPSSGGKPLHERTNYFPATVWICGAASGFAFLVFFSRAYARRHENDYREDRRPKPGSASAPVRGPDGTSLPSQVSHTATAARCGIAAWCLDLAIWDVLQPKVRDWQFSAILVAVAVGLVAWEILARRSLLTLVRSGDGFTVMRRGENRGTLLQKDLRYEQGMDPLWRMRERIILLILSAILVPVGTVLTITTPGVGVVSLAAALLFTAAWIWDLRSLWTVYWVELDDSIGLPRTKTKMSFLMRKPEVVEIFGWWPADQWRRAKSQSN